MMNTGLPAIELDNLTTGYRTRHGFKTVASGISARLERGRFTCLLGPNGAGKSTLLKTLSAMLAPLGGRIIIDGKDVAAYTPRELARLIGVVLTQRLMISNMTAFELISLGRSPYTGFWGKLNPDDRRIVEDAIAQVHIEELQNRMVDTLSDGERQKVMIAKALAQRTPVIFLDEPTAFLDYPSKVEILQLLLRLSHDKGITVFMSTHDLELALQIADEVWLLDKKLGLTVGTPGELASDGSLARYFERDGIVFDAERRIFRINN